VAGGQAEELAREDLVLDCVRNGWLGGALDALLMPRSVLVYGIRLWQAVAVAISHSVLNAGK
jgi:hypothetical protein